MQYNDKPFPRAVPLFPKRGTVLEYLEDYSKEIMDVIHFRTQVQKISLANEISVGQADKWTVTCEHLPSKSIKESTYDAVVVASGHYTVPHVPYINGLERWNKAYPDTIIHSKAYRNPETFAGKKVLVIGNSASGVDIAAQICHSCRHPLLLSSRSESMFISQSTSWRTEVPEVVEYLDPATHYRAVRFADGRTETGIEATVFATGYFYSFPSLTIREQPLITNGLRTENVYEHLFHIEHPSLAFPVLNQKIIPFPLAENQAAVISRVWSGRLHLPSKEAMREWEADVIRAQGDGKKFHVLKFPADVDYLNKLYAWAESAPRVEGLVNNGVGKMGTHWDEKSIWLRGRFPEIKKAYADRGEKRFAVTRVEELGFDFERWKVQRNTSMLQ